MWVRVKRSVWGGDVCEGGEGRRGKAGNKRNKSLLNCLLEPDRQTRYEDS